MDWLSTGIGALVSIGVGVSLWAFLPRGVVLTRAVRTEDAAGNTVYDTWEIKNDSPLPVQITSVRAVTPDFDELDLPWDGLDSVQLTLDDFTAEMRREGRPWSEVVIEPGDTLTAHVITNASLYIDYRRAGWSGLLEQRHLVIHAEP